MKSYEGQGSQAQVFNQGLFITKKWCEFHKNESNQSDVFRPVELSSKVDFCDFNMSVESKIKEINRLNLVKNDQLDLQDAKMGTIAGRVLVFYPELSLNDGMMENESAGFIDQNDCPPCGTWFHFSASEGDKGCALYAWIPDVFVEAVTRAQEVDQYDCLVWLSNESA